MGRKKGKKGETEIVRVRLSFKESLEVEKLSFKNGCSFPEAVRLIISKGMEK